MADATEPSNDVESEGGVATAQAEITEQPRVFYGWYVMGSIMGIHWYLSTTFVYGFQALFLPILTEFGWGRGVGSIAASLRNFENGVMGPFVGVLVDRYGSRAIMTVGVTIMGLGIMSLAFIQNIWMYYLSFLIISFGFSAIVGVPFSAALVNWFHRLRGRALGIGMSGAVLSGPAAVIMFWLVDTYGWRQTAFMTGVGLWLVCIPLAWGVIRSKPADKGLLPDGDAPGSARGEATRRAAAAGPQTRATDAMKDLNFWLTTLIFGVLTMGISSMMLHQTPYFESIGFSRVEAASSLGYFTVLSVFGRLTTGWLMDKFDRRLVLAGLLGSQLIAFIIMLNVTSYWMIAPFGFFFGTAFGGMIPARPLIVTSLFGLRAFGKIQGLLTFTAMPFSIVAPWFLGYTFDVEGSYVMGIWALTALTAAVIPLCFFLRLPKLNRTTTS